MHFASHPDPAARRLALAIASVMRALIQPSSKLSESLVRRARQVKSSASSADTGATNAGAIASVAASAATRHRCPARANMDPLLTVCVIDGAKGSCDLFPFDGAWRLGRQVEHQAGHPGQREDGGANRVDEGVRELRGTRRHAALRQDGTQDDELLAASVDPERQHDG